MNRVSQGGTEGRGRRTEDTERSLNDLDGPALYISISVLCVSVYLKTSPSSTDVRPVKR